MDNDWFYEYFINELKAIGSHSKCADGKSAYDYAVEGGYTGTEEEFAKKLASKLLLVNITESNGTLSADKAYSEIWDAIIAGTTVFVYYNDYVLPLIGMFDGLYFGTIMCDNGDDVNGAAVGSVTIEITPNDVVNDISAQADIPKTLPNPNALTFTGAVTGSYDGSASLSVEIPAGADCKIVTITDNNGTLSADKTFTEIMEAIISGTTVLVYYGGYSLPLIRISDNALFFGAFQCANADDVDPAAVATSMIEITENGEVNDLSALIFIPSVPSALPNPNALKFTGAVTGSYNGSRPLSVKIPSAVTDEHINSLIDTKLGVIENGSY